MVDSRFRELRDDVLQRSVKCLRVPGLQCGRVRSLVQHPPLEKISRYKPPALCTSEVPEGNQERRIVVEQGIGNRRA